MGTKHSGNAGISGWPCAPVGQQGVKTKQPFPLLLGVMSFREFECKEVFDEKTENINCVV